MRMLNLWQAWGSEFKEVLIHRYKMGSLSSCQLAAMFLFINALFFVILKK